MKICIESNSLKLSLTPSEIEAFAHDGLYKEKLQLGDDTLTYLIQRTAEAKVSASFKNNIITILVPERIADEWTSTDQLSFDAIQNEEMHLLVEKDFKSLDTVNENHSSSFMNPLAAEEQEQQN